MRRHENERLAVDGGTGRSRACRQRRQARDARRFESFERWFSDPARAPSATSVTTVGDQRALRVASPIVKQGARQPRETCHAALPSCDAFCDNDRTTPYVCRYSEVCS
jgi:hypothetical protein